MTGDTPTPDEVYDANVAAARATYDATIAAAEEVEVEL